MLDDLQALMKQFEQHQETVRSFFRELSMEIPDYLIRIHYLVPESKFNERGYFLPQEHQWFYPNQPALSVSLSMVHPDDFEIVARSFAFTQYLERGSYFTLIYIHPWKVEFTGGSKRAQTLTHGEFYGRIPQTAVLKTERYTWEKGNQPMNVNAIAQTDAGILTTKDYHPVLLKQ